MGFISKGKFGALLFRAFAVGVCAVFLFIVPSSATNISVSGAITKKNLKESPAKLPPPSITVKPTVKTAVPPADKKAEGIEKNSGQITRSGQFISMNFEAAPIREVIKSICELLGMNYIIESEVGGFVTIRTVNKIPLRSSLELLDQLLVLNNLTRVKVGDYWRFLSVSNSFKEPMHIYSDRPLNEISEQNRFHIYILTFNYVSVDQILNIIKPFLSKNAATAVLPRSNMLLLVERGGAKVQSILNLVKAIDIDSLDKMQVKLFELKEAEVEEVQKEIVSIFAAMGYQQGPKGITFLGLPRLNSILVINPYPNMYSIIKSWMEKLDTGSLETAEIITFIYHVQNGSASTLAGILQSLYSVDLAEQFKDQKIKVMKSSKAAPEPADKAKQASKTSKVTPGIQTLSEDANIIGPIHIVAYEDTNSIIIRTAKKNYPAIVDTLKKLDVMPQQVLIEVLIAELSLEDEFRFGLEWALKSGNSTIAQNFGGLGDSGSVAGNLANTGFNPVGSTGLSLFTRDSTNAMGLLKALATESRIEVRANPVLLTRNNMTATIDITQDFPIRTTTTTDTGTVENVQYKPVGIRLRVTPKINRDNFVSLAIDQEYSTAPSSFEGDPPVSRRQAVTNVIVKDKETLIIGGLIRKDKIQSEEGLPFLYKIPILGWLFGSKKKTNSGTEVLLFITPNIVNNPDEAKNLTDEFRKRMKELKLSVLTSNKSGEGKEEGEKTIMSN